MIRRAIELTGSDATRLTAMQYDAQNAITLQIGRGRYVTLAAPDARELAAWIIGHATEDPDAEPTLIGQTAWAEGVAALDARTCTIPECSGYGTVHQ